MNLHWLTLHQAAQLIAQKELSPVELTQACLGQIERLEPQLNAFITLTPELALEQARQLEAEIRRGEIRGPLHGIPIALKDLYETAGIRTTAGSKFFKDFIPETDAAVVDSLQRAGVILLGKLNMHEIALGLTNENPHFGTCRNPWDQSRIPGGSSGGSGAALAAGMCLGSLGSDTGGSIRVPAALCGIVGLKPTYGRVSLRGAMPLSWHLDHAGPMARCVRDVALLLQAIAGYDPADPSSIAIPVDDYLVELDRGVDGLRVALAVGEYFRQIDAGIWSLVEAAASVFADLGAQVEMIDIPGFEAAAQSNSRMTRADAAAFHQERLADRPEYFGEDVLERLQMGAKLKLSEYIFDRRMQTVFHRQMESLLSKYDLLLLPVTPIPAPAIQPNQAVQLAGSLTRFTSVFDLTGMPAVSLPCGFLDVEGRRLPVGLQIAACPWAEAKLLRGAFAYEQATGWYLQHPDFGEQA